VRFGGLRVRAAAPGPGDGVGPADGAAGRDAAGHGELRDVDLVGHLLVHDDAVASCCARRRRRRRRSFLAAAATGGSAHSIGVSSRVRMFTAWKKSFLERDSSSLLNAPASRKVRTFASKTSTVKKRHENKSGLVKRVFAARHCVRRERPGHDL